MMRRSIAVSRASNDVSITGQCIFCTALDNRLSIVFVKLVCRIVYKQASQKAHFPMNSIVTPTSETTPTMLNFPPPTWLKHAPIFMLPYEPFDGPYAGNTDAKYLSIGLAQWRNADDPDAVSAKVWRFPDAKWSRMSEELPLHRLADLCTLLVKMVYQPHLSSAAISTGTFEGQQEKLELRSLNSFPAGFEKSDNNERTKQRLRRLRDELNTADLN
jgi:hypothetical protein